jgi:hypothetical protein
VTTAKKDAKKLGTTTHADFDEKSGSVADLELEAIVRARTGTFPGPVCDLDVTGCKVEYPESGAPSLPLGGEVALEFTGKRLKRNITLYAHIHGKLNEVGARQYQFQFFAKPGQDPGEIFSIFNRRRAYRAPAVQTTPVETRYADPGFPLSKPAIAELADISATGIGLIVSVDDESRLSKDDWLRLNFELPSFGAPIELIACIRYRVLLASKAVRYGAVFKPDEPDFMRKQDKVVHYVMQYQQKTLKYRG